MPKIFYISLYSMFMILLNVVKSERKNIKLASKTLENLTRRSDVKILKSLFLESWNLSPHNSIVLNYYVYSYRQKWELLNKTTTTTKSFWIRSNGSSLQILINASAGKLKPLILYFRIPKLHIKRHIVFR